MKRYIALAVFVLAVFLLLKYPPQPKTVEARMITIEETPIVIKEEPILIIEEEDVPEIVPYEFIHLREDLQIYMEELCADYDLDFFLCAALMESESTFVENAISRDGKDIGLFQIRSTVWEKHFKEQGLDIYDPYDNIECGLLIIKDLLDKYPTETALQCYKCGETRGLELMKEGTVLKTVSNILDRTEEWKRKEP